MHGVRQPGSTGATRGARPLSALAALALALSACAGSAPADPAGSVQQEGGMAPGGGDVQGAPLSQTGQPAAGLLRTPHRIAGWAAVQAGRPQIIVRLSIVCNGSRF